MNDWPRGRGALGPFRPLIGEWISEAAGEGAASATPCARDFRPLGDGWIELDARWTLGPDKTYREVALIGQGGEPTVGVWSFTSDGKRSQGVLADASDVHPRALAFEAHMPAGLARMVYWPLEAGEGFYFAVERRTKKGWSRFLRHRYRRRTD
jgi:hypothetical protein